MAAKYCIAHLFDEQDIIRETQRRHVRQRGIQSYYELGRFRAFLEYEARKYVKKI
jgi:hypothetical protein